MEKKSIYIFLHLPKTGGTTFSQHLVKNLKKDEIMSTSQLRYNLIPPNIKKDKIRVILGHATYYGIHKLFPEKNPRYVVFLRDPADRFVSSYNFEMRTKPGANISFWKWYESQLKNEMVYFLDMKFRGKEGAKANLPRKTLPFFARIFQNKKIYMFFQKLYETYISLFQSSERINNKKLKNAKKLLDNCWHIGFIDNLDESLKFLFREIGVPTKWKDQNITEKSKSFFKLDNKGRKRIYRDNRYDISLYKYALKLQKINFKSPR
jgi:hypothetical protein